MNHKEKEITVRQLQEDSLEVLNISEVKTRLGSYATRLSEAVERTDFVDVDGDGFLDIKGYRPALVPVVARHIGERAILRAEDSGMNLRQIESLTKKSNAHTASVASDKLHRHFTATQAHSELTVFEGESQLAVTSTNYWAPNERTIVSGRPYVSMNMNGRVNDKLSPVVFLHEMTHVLQSEADPVRKIETFPRDKIRRELEAYYVAAQIIMGFKDAGRQRELLEHSAADEMNAAHKIERIRAAHQVDSDPFSPNNKVVMGLVNNGFGFTSELRKLVDNIKK